jgi:acyl carrier protein
MQEIINRINQHIADSFGFDDPSEIQPDFDLRQDLNATELELADFIAKLEQEFQVEISAEEIRALTTVQELYELMSDKLNEVS